MADPDIVEIACARAWGVYLLINRGIDENDARRDKLRHFIRIAGRRATTRRSFWRSRGSNISNRLDGSPTG